MVENNYKGTFGETLYNNLGGSYRTENIYQNSLNYTLKIAEFYYKLDPSKANFKL